jgi:hypothetical protein
MGPDQWQKLAPHHEGSWWMVWVQFSSDHSGGMVAPPVLGGSQQSKECIAQGRCRRLRVAAVGASASCLVHLFKRVWRGASSTCANGLAVYPRASCLKHQQNQIRFYGMGKAAEPRFHRSPLYRVRGPLRLEALPRPATIRQNLRHAKRWGSYVATPNRGDLRD